MGGRWQVLIDAPFLGIGNPTGVVENDKTKIVDADFCVSCAHTEQLVSSIFFSQTSLFMCTILKGNIFLFPNFRHI